MADDKLTYWEVHLDEEIPTFGCGRRRILVVERGQKFVTLLLPTDCTTDRTPIAVWDRLKPIELLLPAWNYQEMAVRLERVSREYDRNTAAYRLAMGLLGFPVPEPELTEEQKATRKAAGDRLQAARTKVEYVPGKGERAGQGEGSGKLMQRLWMTGSYTPERLVEIVLSNWPGRTTKVSDVKYNYNILLSLPPAELKTRFGTEVIPAWPVKKVERKAEPAPTMTATTIKPAPVPDRTKKPAAESRKLKEVDK